MYSSFLPREPQGAKGRVGLRTESYTVYYLQPEEVRLIDFQISSWGSPVNDLLYFFSTVNGKVLEQRDAVVAEYHAELAASRRAMGASLIPELHDLQVENTTIICFFGDSNT